MDDYAHRARDRALIERLRAGDERAFGELYDTWFDAVHDLALRIVRSPALAAEVTQDCFLSAWQRLDSLRDPDAFGGWLLRIARNRALNVLDKEQRSVAAADETMAAIEREGSPVSAPDGFRVEDRLARASDPAAAVEDAELVALVWSAADALGERDRTVLDLQLRHGLTPAEIGEVVGVNRNAANQLVHRVKGRLDAAIGARVLWNGPAPACDELARELSHAGVQSFGPEALKVAERHAPRCDRCRERQKLRLQPAALFSAIPIAVAPVLLKQQAAAALASAGVPMSGSAHAPGSAGSAHGDSGMSPKAGEGHAAVGGMGAGSGRGRRWVRAGVMAAAFLAVMLVGLLAVSGEEGEDPGQSATESLSFEPTTSSTATASTSTTAPPATASPPQGGEGAPVPPPGSSTTSAPTTTTQVEIQLEVAISPSSVQRFYSLGPSDVPELSWSVVVSGIDAGELDIQVSGVELSLAGQELSGSTRLCPGPSPQGVCDARAGTYTYTVSVVGPGGEVLISASETLTITEPTVR